MTNTTTRLNADVNVDEQLKEINSRREEIRDNRIKISGAIADAQHVIEGLENDSFSVSKWLGDELFRPGNPQRKARALAELRGLVEDLRTLDNKAQELSDCLNEMRLLMLSMKIWADSIVELIPMFSFSMSLPNFSSFLDNLISTLEFVGTLAVIVFLKFKGIKLFSLKASAIFIALTIVFELIAGIIQGEERKKKFEQIASEAQSNRVQVRENIASLDSSLYEIRSYFLDILNVYKAAGLTSDNTTEISKIREIVETSKNTFQLLQKDFDNTMKLAVVPGIDPDLVISTLAGKDEAKYRALWAGLLIRQNSSIDEITKKLNITPDEARKAKATALLLEGQSSPSEIAQSLNVPTANLENIMQTESYKTIVDMKEKVN